MAVITISSFTRQPRSNFAGSTCTLRVWYSRDFIDSTGQSVAGGPDFYTPVSCTISSGVITVAAFTVYSTIDSQDPNPQSIQVFAQFYTSNNTRKRDQVFSENGCPTGWQVPSSLGASISYAQLVIYNQTSTIENPPRTFYTADQTNDAIEAALYAPATTTQNGIGRINQNAVTAATPIFVGQNTIPINVKDYAYGAIGDGTTNDTAAFSLAITAAAGKGLFVPNGTYLLSNITFPATVGIVMEHGAILKPITGQTITIVGSFNADASQHFSNATAGLGTVVFTGNTSLGDIYPQWWGAIGDDSTDCAAAFQAMLAINWYNGSLSGARFRIPTGIYRIGTGLTYRGNFVTSFLMDGESQGEGAVGDGPTFKFTGSAGGTLFQMLGANYCQVRNITFYGNGLALRTFVWDYDSSRSMSSFECEVTNCTFGGATGVDSALLVTGTSNFASAEHIIQECRFIGHSTPGTTYYAIKNFGSANAKNYTVRGGSIGFVRYGVDLGNSGFHKIDGVSFSGNTVTDVVPNVNQVSMKDCGSEGSAGLAIHPTIGATVAGSLTIQDCYWHGNTVTDDYVIIFPGQLTLIGNDLYNGRVAGSVPAIKNATGPVIGVTIPSSSFVSINNTYHNLADEKLPLYDTSDRLVADLAQGGSGNISAFSFGDKSIPPGGGVPIYNLPVWMTNAGGFGGFIAQTSTNGYAPLYKDGVIVMDATAGARTVDIQEIANLGLNRRYLVIKGDSSANAVTVSTSTGDSINASTSVVLYHQYDFVEVVATSTSQWVVVRKSSTISTGAVLSISSNTITPTNPIHHVGAGLIKTITVPSNNPAGPLYLIPDAAFTTDTTANIGLASTATVGRIMIFVFDGADWWPNY